MYNPSRLQDPKFNINVGDSNFAVPWETKLNLCFLTNHPSIELNQAGHSETLGFEKLLKKHQYVPIDQIEDTSAFSSAFDNNSLDANDDISRDFDLNQDEEESEEPKNDLPQVYLYYQANGVITVGIHGLPPQAKELSLFKDFNYPKTEALSNLPIRIKRHRFYSSVAGM